MRLLLVSADDSLRERWRDGLEALGWEVHAARDVRSAIDVAIQHQPLVIVTKLHPPEVSGYHYVRALRSVLEHDVTVIGLKRDADAPSADERVAGFDLLVSPEITVELLQECITSARDPDPDRKRTTRFPNFKRER